MIVAAYISYAQTWAFLPLVAKILGEFDARRGRAYTVMEHSVRNFRMSTSALNENAITIRNSSLAVKVSRYRH